MRGQRDRGDLGLVAHLGQKEGDQGGAEHTEPLGDLGFLFFDLVWNQGPEGHADERQTQRPAQDLGAERRRDPAPERTCQAMVHDGRSQDAEDDRHRFLEARCEDEGEELGLVADFSKGDDAGRDEEGFHALFPGRSTDD